jgi:nicotinamidase-related amidase
MSVSGLSLDRMSTLEDRPNTALLVVDVQNGVVDGSHNRDQVVANIASLVERARAADVPIVWVQHNSDELPRDSEPWQYVPELKQDEAEPVVHKQYGDSFEDTDLEAVLAERGIGRLVVAGAQTDCCILATLHGATVRGYDATLVEDAHTTEDLSQWGGASPDKVIDHVNLYWANSYRAPGRTTGTARSDEVTFR